MEKLMILLREYEKNRKTMKKFPYGNYNNVKNNRFIIISKEYWFIKWLVDNDKIDLLRLDNRIALSEFNKVERVLMALSIQDNPIEFLCSVLK